MDDEELRERCYSVAQLVLAAAGVKDDSVTEACLDEIGKVVYEFAKQVACPHKTLKCFECELDTIVHRDDFKLYTGLFICGACGNY